MKRAVCPKCGETYQVGFNGVIDGCDRCLNIERDQNGYAWFSDEQSHTYKPVNGGAEFTVNRKVALPKD